MIFFFICSLENYAKIIWPPQLITNFFAKTTLMISSCYYVITEPRTKIWWLSLEPCLVLCSSLEPAMVPRCCLLWTLREQFSTVKEQLECTQHCLMHVLRYTITLLPSDQKNILSWFHPNFSFLKLVFVYCNFVWVHMILYLNNYSHYFVGGHRDNLFSNSSFCIQSYPLFYDWIRVECR